jgi:serine/threonine protein kinase
MSSSEPPATGDRPSEQPGGGSLPEPRDGSEPGQQAGDEAARHFSERAAAEELAAEPQGGDERRQLAQEGAGEHAAEPPGGEQPAQVSDGAASEQPAQPPAAAEGSELAVGAEAWQEAAEADGGEPAEQLAQERTAWQRAAEALQDQDEDDWRTSEAEGAGEQVAEAPTSEQPQWSSEQAVAPEQEAALAEDDWEVPAHPAVPEQAAEAPSGEQQLAQGAGAREPAAEAPEAEEPSIELTRHSSPGYSPGDLIDQKYRLVRILEEGGTAVVWVAHHLALDQEVGLKLISLEATWGIAEVTQRMRVEARIAGELGHPGICRVFDFGITEAGDPYVVSELLEGETLTVARELEPQMPATRAVALMLPIVDALAVAHAKGIVHREVKPDNIFLARDTSGQLQPKLLDFGIARFVESDVQLTVDGSVAGTPEYAAPEHVLGARNEDARTDIWSVCVVLYELVAGSKPSEGTEPDAPPRPLQDQGLGEDSLWIVLERGLQRDREQRWQSMRELGHALALWLQQQGASEDIRGVALETTWLASGPSEAPAEVAERARALPEVSERAHPPAEVSEDARLPSEPAERPAHEAEPPAARSVRESDRAGQAQLSVEPVATLDYELRTVRPASRSRGKWVAATVVGLLLLSVGLVAVLGVEDAGDESADVPVATVPLPPSPPPLWAQEAERDAAPAASSSARPGARVPRAARRTWPTRRATTQRHKARPASRRGKPARSKGRDWGF